MVGRKRGAWGSTERFWRRFDRSGGDDACWPLIGLDRANGYGASLSPGGYPRANYRGKQTTAARVAYLLTHGPSSIPQELVVMHSCDNPPCCNPAHLLLGTKADNTTDMMNKRRDYWRHRTHCKNGHAFDQHSKVVTRKNGHTFRRCSACRQEKLY